MRERASRSLHSNLKVSVFKRQVERLREKSFLSVFPLSSFNNRKHVKALVDVMFPYRRHTLGIGQ